MKIVHRPYWGLDIVKCEKHYNATYMGPWAIKRKDGWSEQPCEIFYVENPDTSLGHSHYFGLFMFPFDRESLMITRGDSAFSEDIVGAYGEDGEVVVSRYRHDYIEHGAFMIDGGRDYTRLGGKAGEDFQTTAVFVEGPDFFMKDDLGNVTKLEQEWKQHMVDA